MKTLRSLLALLILAALPAAAAATDALNDALRRGLLAEEAQRDLPAAVAAYAEAVRAGDDLRASMATALFRLAECRRRLGQTNEAQGLYRRLLREFQDQTNVVSLARRQVPRTAVRSRGTDLIEAELRENANALRNAAAAEAELAAELERYSAMRPEQLHFALAASHPTPELTRLKSERNQAEVRRASLNPDFGPQHPEVLRIAAVQAKLDEQSAKEMEGVMGSLTAQLSNLRARIDQERSKRNSLAALHEEALGSGNQNEDMPVDPRSEQEQLLLQEIKIAENQEADLRKRLEAGRAGQDQLFKSQREVLALKRQLAAFHPQMDGWIPPVKAGGDAGGTVSVVGQVSRPGRIELPAGKSMDLIEAIAASGGLTKASERKRIKVRRDNLVQILDWDDALKNRFELRPGDVVEVGEIGF